MDHIQKNVKENLKCIWMCAGIVNYKLCYNDFDCENCKFDQVMRGILDQENLCSSSGKRYIPSDHPLRITHIDKLVNQAVYHLISDCKIHLDRFYHSSQLWFKWETADLFQIGIDKLLLKILEPVEKIITPQTGKFYQKGQLIAWIIRKEKTFPLHSPLKGMVVEINKNLSFPKYKGHFEEDSYLFKMKYENSKDEIQNVFGEIRGINCYINNVKIIKQHLKKAFQNNALMDIGTTFTDGGILEKNLEKILGEKIFQELIFKLLQVD
jgi:glycine cleavage system H lipoate-binding protein